MTMNLDFIITEIFASIQGESVYAGHPCTFIRLTGCPLRCSWCDTVYGYKGGTKLSMAEILAQVAGYGISMVELTGGEPLAQKGTARLAELLIAQGHRVLIETSGALSISELPQAVHIVMDIKCPDSGMAEKNLWSNLESLKVTDEIKFVVASRDDFLWGKSVIADYGLIERFAVSFSPAWGLVAPKDLAAWIIESRLPCRLNLQQHKYIWGPDVQGV
jgi:7-carboxy-7-deazaguanine synthase